MTQGLVNFTYAANTATTTISSASYNLAVTYDAWQSWANQVPQYRTLTPEEELTVTEERRERRERHERVMREAQELAARQARERAQRQREAQERIAHAQENAKALLISLLSPQEQIIFNDGNGPIIIRGSDGELYRLRYDGDFVGNVYLLDDHGCDVQRWCIHPATFVDHELGVNIPIFDSVASQVVWLRADAPGTTDRGNMYDPRGCEGEAGPGHRRSSRGRRREVYEQFFPTEEAA